MGHHQSMVVGICAKPQIEPLSSIPPNIGLRKTGEALPRNDRKFIAVLLLADMCVTQLCWGQTAKGTFPYSNKYSYATYLTFYESKALYSRVKFFP